MRVWRLLYLAMRRAVRNTGVVPDDTPNDPNEGALPPRVSAEVDKDIGLGPEVQKKIREKAYALYQARLASGTNPDHLADWYEAEREIMDKYRSPVTDVGPPRWDDSPRRGRNGPDR
jgi:hypothetical protein